MLSFNLERRRSTRTAPPEVAWPRIVVITTTFLLVVIGLVMVYSASSIVNIDAEVNPAADMQKQLLFAGAGLGVCVLLALVIPYRWWRGNATWVVFFISIGLLVLTAAIGTVGLGAQRWLTLGPINLQPSEFAKIGILLAVVKLVMDYQEGRLAKQPFVILFIVLNLFILGLIFVAQSDLGTTLICVVGMTAILWFSEIRLRWIGLYLGIFTFLGTLGMMSGYRLQRLLSFTHPWDDPYGTGYQIIHSMYAFAQGGIFGAGIGNSAEKYLYLPEASTDFIFAVIGEELGLIGALFVLALFVAFLIGGLRMAQAAPDRFGAVLCGSFAVIIVFQAFLNIGCVIGFMPITGKPLPFISAGGSSLIASLMMVGIMLSVSYASGEPAVYRRRREGIRPVGWDDYGQKKRAGARGRDATRSAYAGSGVRRWEPSLVGSAPRSRSGGRAGAGSRPHGL